jgi:benzoyl-CoA-dihydrodiol lyase
MAGTPRPEPVVVFETHPDRYRHWKLDFPAEHGGAVARLRLEVDEAGGLRPPGTPDGYTLKLNSYDLGVDVELADAIQRIRFEHPEVRALCITSDRERVFCSGANIYMLGTSSHFHKVNFCKFTNETRVGIEELSAKHGIPTLAALNGTASGGGYELATSCDEIVLVEDGSSVVSLPEVPLLAVLPGTGGLTRLVDKRKIRRDRADVFSTVAEGLRGKRAVEWGLVDEAPPRARFAEAVKARLVGMVKRSTRRPFPAVKLAPLDPKASPGRIEWRYVTLELDPAARTAALTVHAPSDPQPATPAELAARGADAWALRAFRELDAALLELRFNQPEIGVVTLHARGDRGAVRARGTPREVLASPSIFPLAVAEGFRNLVPCRSVSRSVGQAVVRLGETGEGAEVHVLGEDLPEDARLLGLRATDILLAVEEPRGLSARNVLPARVVAIDAVGGARLCRCAVRGSDVEIAAELTPEACAELGLVPGKAVHLVVKSAACTVW